MRYRSPFRVSTAILLGVGLGLTGCARPPAGPPAPPPAAVPVSLPVEREVTDHADFTARIAAVDSVEVRARVPGYLDRVNFKEGDPVRKGDVLFKIDPRPYQAALDQAKAQVAQDGAKLKYDESDVRRLQRLSGTVSQSELDKAISARDVSIANVAADKALVTSRELDLQYTKVVAPVAGRVSRYAVTVGNLIQSGDQGGTLLTTIVSVDPVYAYFDVDELTVQRVRRMIRAGKLPSAAEGRVPVSLGLATDEGFPHAGTINFVDNQVTPKTGTLRVRGVFPNPGEVLVPGFFARVRVPVGPPRRALLVTDRALDNDQGQKVLYVVNEKNEVAARPVRVGALHDGLRVIEDGLRPGDRVIVNGLHQVRPGVTVEAKLVPMPTRAEVGGQKSDVGTTATAADRGKHP